LPDSVVSELQQAHKMLGYVEIARWALLVIAIVAAVVSAIAVARSGAIPLWQRNSNSVSFILSHNPNMTNGNKVQ
jgi:hypothetical protein